MDGHHDAAARLRCLSRFDSFPRIHSFSLRLFLVGQIRNIRDAKPLRFGEPVERLNAADRVSDAVVHKPVTDAVVVEELVEVGGARFDGELDPSRLPLAVQWSMLRFDHRKG
jgi:hypothetical protein